MNEPKPATPTCPKCGAPLSGNALDGLCPNCVARLALETIRVPEETVPAPALPIERPGDRIGRYKLLQQIGEGGCGVVYMAEQEQPVRRRVALKVIKLGMDTKAVIARFEAERQALALMDHPNIAKVLDGGATDNGRPYFVMELVRGIKVTDYCDQNTLSTRERLDLFVQICRAIQHAHQKGIIHRDIKPSNVLVTLHDGVPVPKVIDFGIAKATTDQRLTDKTLFTAFEQFIGTPAYMSPEQAEMSALDIDTRNDIYSLGVLLYELLTGRTPFDAEELMAVGLDAMRRTIREKEPVRPSTRLSTLLEGDLTITAKRRQTIPPKLINLLRGDLDWIVMKALEKDRTRRYETANGFATDILRHLHSEPVVARPPSKLYRFQKLARRNKAAFAATGAVAVAVVGLGFSLWSLGREKQAKKAQTQLRQQAQTEASRSKAVAELLNNMLRGADPSAALGHQIRSLGEILDQTAERLGRDLPDQPGVEAELRNTIGEAYWGLGEYAKAEAVDRQALALRRKLLGNDHPAVAQSLHNLGLALWSEGRLPEAEAFHREALAMRRKLLGNEHVDVAQSLNDLALVFYSQVKPAEAETMSREALAIRRRLLGNENPGVAESLSVVATALWSQSKLPEAESMFRDALAMQKKLLGPEHPEVIISLGNLSQVLRAEGNLAEAESLLREELALQEKVLGKEHPDVATSLNNLALILWAQGKMADAEAMQRDAISLKRRLLGTDHQDVATLLNNLAFMLWKQGKLADAEATDREVLAMRRKLLGNDNPDVAASLDSLANVLRDENKLSDAEAASRESLNIRQKKTPDDWRTFSGQGTLGAILLDQKQYAQAETFLLASFEGMKLRQDRIPADHKIHLQQTAGRLVQLYEATGRPDQAAQWKTKVLDQ